MRIINSDGNEAEMCGNGLRAIFSHLFRTYPQEAPFQVDSLYKTHKGWQCSDGEIAIEMGEAELLGIKKTFSSFQCDLIDTGVPHLVLERKEIAESFLEIAPRLRHHPDLPKGANVNYVEWTGQEWKVTTYERGVEGITEACGTGVTAAALSLALHEEVKPPIRLLTVGGDRLTVDWQGSPKNPKNLSLKGNVNLVFEGTLPLGIPIAMNNVHFG